MTIANNNVPLSFGELKENVHARYTREGRAGQVPVLKIVVADRLQTANPQTLAALLAHESTHLRDDLADLYKPTVDGCLEFEVHAYSEQSQVWQAFHGAYGKQNAVDEVEQELNGWLAAYRRGPDSLFQRIRQIYLPSCVEQSKQRGA